MEHGHFINNMKKDVQKYLLNLARYTIARELEIDFEEPISPIEKILKEKRGVFVTLEIDGGLRGCIGNILPVYPLEEAVERNAVNAAFGDPRFTPLTRAEFVSVEIEISVLSVPEKLEYKSADDLLVKLKPLKDGVVIKKGGYEATYLPQVWEELRDKEMFLGSLCAKAGLAMDEWRKGDLEVSIYNVELFKEQM